MKEACWSYLNRIWERSWKLRRRKYRGRRHCPSSDGWHVWEANLHIHVGVINDSCDSKMISRHLQKRRKGYWRVWRDKSNPWGKQKSPWRGRSLECQITRTRPAHDKMYILGIIRFRVPASLGLLSSEIFIYDYVVHMLSSVSRLREARKKLLLNLNAYATMIVNRGSVPHDIQAILNSFLIRPSVPLGSDKGNRP